MAALLDFLGVRTIERTGTTGDEEAVLGRTEAEIAHELGISQQAVSKIKQKAIQKLRELLKGLL